MKNYLPTALALACVILVISLVVMKRGDNEQHETDAGTVADFSNQLWSAQTQIAICNGTAAVLSNHLDEARSATLTVSNQLMESQSAVVFDAGEITNLNRQVAALESENRTISQTLDQRVMNLTNQVANLTNQIVLTRASLDQVNKDYALLENRLRRDVAERVVVERKFNNLLELQAQIQNLKQNPAREISAASIYAGLDVEVKSNTFHVISPD